MLQRPQILRVCFLVALLLLVTIPFIGVMPIFQVSEAREGVVIHEMLSSHEFILPLRNGDTIPSKPILFHWVGAVTAYLTNNVGEFIVRLPSVIGAVGLLALAYILGLSLFGIEGGVVTSLILLSTYGFTRMATDGRVDMLFSFFACASFGVLLPELVRLGRDAGSIRELPSSKLRISALFAGLATLTKGPLGLVLPALQVFATTLILFKPRELLYYIRPALLWALLIPLPWYLLATIAGSEGFLGRQLIFENIERMLGGEGITKKPFWFYCVAVFDHGAPWTIVLAVALIIQKFRRGGENIFNYSEPYIDRPVIRVLCWACFAPIVFFSLSSGKRAAYLLPLLPFFSLLFAAYLLPRLKLGSNKIIDSAVMLLNGVIVCVFVLFLFPDFLHRLHVGLGLGSKSGGALFLEAFIYTLKSYGATYVLVGSTALLFALVARIGIYRSQIEGRAFVVTIPVLIITSVIVQAGVHSKGYTHSYKFFAQQLHSEVYPDEELFIVKKRRDESFDGLFFYMMRHFTFVEPNEVLTQPGRYLARRSWISALSSELQSKISIVLEGGRACDNPDERLVLFNFSS